MPGPGSWDVDAKDLVAQVQSPVVGGQAETTRKLKSLLTGQDSDSSINLSPSPPKRFPPSSTPPTSIGLPRWNSTDALPTPPIALQAEIMATRRVRSGPKERNPPMNCDATPRVKSGPIERHRYDAESSSTTGSEKKNAERTGSGDKRKKKLHGDSSTSREELSVYYDENVKPLLSQMEMKLSERNASELCQDCLKLWNVLDRKGMIGKACGSASARRRGEILRTVFKFLDIHDPRLLLRLARLVLSVSTILFLLICRFHLIMLGPYFR